MSQIKFTSTKLSAMGKKGILTPDADGYYELVVGGLNTFNSAGQYYVLDGAKALFEESSTFMRRIREGVLLSEMGHPQKLPGMSDDDYIRRILTIDEQNVCAHIREVWLDESYGRNHPEHQNPQLVAIMAKVKPYGPKGQYLKESLENPYHNTAASIRALTRDYYQRGQTYRVLTHICTYDFVHHNGVPISNKYNTPSLESICEQSVTISKLEKMVESIPEGISLESNAQLINCIRAVKQESKVQSLIHKW